MTADEFRALALGLPAAVEGEHMGHPDFRIGAGRIFATLDFPEPGWAMVKLSPEQQAVVIAASPRTFAPAKGGWGRGGSTLVRLASAQSDEVRDALALAAEGSAPAKRVRRAK
jgi:hypothetical protein